MTRRADWITAASGPLHGDVSVPGDKSISHRALLLAALAEGRSSIHGFLDAEDTICTAQVLQQLGVRIDIPDSGQRVVHGVGLHGLQASVSALDCGNSGTGMRLLAGLLAGQTFDSELVGDASLSRRPMRRIIDPLSSMGARIAAAADGLSPLRIAGGQTLHGVSYTAPVASAQVKSAVLLAGLYARGDTEVIEPQPTRDYTERMLAAFGWPIEHVPGRVRLAGGHCLHANHVAVPADFSSAAFFMVAASIVPGSCIGLTEVGLNPRRTGLVRALSLMGANIEIEPLARDGGEPVGNIVVRYAPLRGVDIPAALVADMIDEFPALFVAAAAASGITRIRGIAELRVKESDRLATMAAGLRALGVSVNEHADGIDITGSGNAFAGGRVDSHGDHRIAMSFAVAGQIASGPIHIEDCAAVGTSFPGFIGTARAAGLSLRETAGT